MNFELTQDQQMLQESLQKFLAGEYAFEHRKQILKTEHGFSSEVWTALAEQGVLGVGLPEQHNGFGGAVETMVVTEQLGRALFLEPYVSTVVLGGGLLRDFGTRAQQSEFLPRIAAGECRVSLAHHEAGARYVIDYVQTTATVSGKTYALSGKKTVVLDGAVADLFIVSANDPASGKLSLFLVDANANGVKVVRYRTHDGRNAADVTLSGVQLGEAQLLGSTVGDGLKQVESAYAHGIAALCSEAVGAMEALNEATVDYLKSRKQFGVPIGKFQALQHRAADMFLMATQARSMSFLATGRCDEKDVQLRQWALSSAKAFIGKAGRFIGQNAVQLHGGMGISAELSAGHYFKRLTAINSTFGDTDYHIARISDLILSTEV